MWGPGSDSLTASCKTLYALRVRDAASWGVLSGRVVQKIMSFGLNISRLGFECLFNTAHVVRMMAMPGNNEVDFQFLAERGLDIIGRSRMDRTNSPQTGAQRCLTLHSTAVSIMASLLA